MGNARAISISRFTNFEEQERAVKKYAYPAFCVAQDPFARPGEEEEGAKTEYLKTKITLPSCERPLEYHKENRFEAKGNYMNHASTGLV